MSVEPKDFKSFVAKLNDEDITSNEPHVTMRCEENNISLQEVKNALLGRGGLELIRIVEDRQKVYKLYYRLNKKSELKIIIDLFTHNTVNVRTVKRLVNKYKLGSIKKQRF